MKPNIDYDRLKIDTESVFLSLDKKSHNIYFFLLSFQQPQMFYVILLILP